MGSPIVLIGLKELLAKATAARSGDELAGIAAESSVERVAAGIGAVELARPRPAAVVSQHRSCDAHACRRWLAAMMAK
jgi:ethanolamine ammonia-lyase large subunit